MRMPIGDIRIVEIAQFVDQDQGILMIQKQSSNQLRKF